jgi:MFS family permease
MRDIGGHTVIVSMTVLGGCAAFFVGNAYNAQMPGFAHDLGHGDPGVAYSMLLAADAAGAMLAGVVLESRAILTATPRTAIVLAIVWACALAGFALSTSYALAVALLFVAGFFELAFNSMATALVQLNAPVDMRGRVIGLYNMASLGLRAFSGVTVGIVGSLIGVHWSLALFALITLAIACALLGLGTGKRSA